MCWYFFIYSTTAGLETSLGPNSLNHTHSLASTENWPNVWKTFIKLPWYSRFRHQPHIPTSSHTITHRLTWKPSEPDGRGCPGRPAWCDSGLGPAWWSWAALRRWPSRKPALLRCSSASVTYQSQPHTKKNKNTHTWGKLLEQQDEGENGELKRR